MHPTPPPPALPVIPGYTLIKRLAVGGMGQVFLARREGAMGFSKLVALKQLLPAYARNDDFLAMFGNEAQVAGLMAHKNLLTTWDCGVSDGLPWLAMEFIHGLSLREVMKRSVANRQAIPPVTMAHIAVQVLEGLDAAHETRDSSGALVGLVHRDLSPPNILVGFDGLVKVLDFGIAKCTEGEPLTTTPTVKGRFAYMPPEQIRGEPVDRRADLFAVGAILYEVLSGQRAFPGPTMADVVRQVAACEVRPLSEVAPQLPVALADVVMKSLSADRQWRFSSAREMAAALRASVDGMLGLSVVRLLESLSTKEERALHLVAQPVAAPAPHRPSPPVPKVTVPALPPPGFDPMAETRPVRLTPPPLPGHEPQGATTSPPAARFTPPSASSLRAEPKPARLTPPSASSLRGELSPEPARLTPPTAPSPRAELSPARFTPPSAPSPRGEPSRITPPSAALAGGLLAVPRVDPTAETAPLRFDPAEVPTSETALPAEPATIIGAPFGPVAPPPLPPRLTGRRAGGVTGFFRAMFRTATA